MKRITLIFITVILTLCLKANRMIRVVDGYDSNPVTGATVIDKSGMILGITDNNGQITIASNNAPVTIRCIGYEPITTSGDTLTVSLRPSAYQLNEVVITPVDRPIRRIICYAREYSSGITGSDTMQYYCEFMTEAFVADGKVKGYRAYDARPTPKGIKRYARITKDGTDSIFSPQRGDDITDLSWFDFMAFLPDKKIELPDKIKNGAETDTVFGKYGPQFIFRKRNNLFTKTADVLSGHKNRTWSPFLFKLIGMTVDIDAGSWTLSFLDKGSDAVGIDDFICGTYNIHMIGKGKWIRKIFNSKSPVEMDAYLEIHPIEIIHCSIDEYKEMRDGFSTIPFRYPPAIQPLSPAIKELVDVIESSRPEK